ncbi:CvpA family protein [uncultured Legionella sp.]|uniref:CvpA family protein n=1 Tax=uncultured Legionella sp. TaxID=210934 RepID=UPI002611BC10|nr:CvpA family protein [uncultured Legionella sp.]
MNIEFNWIDYGFLIIFLLSIIFGFIRGFIGGVVSLLFLIAALYLAMKLSPQLAAQFTGPVAHEQTVSYMILIGIFLLVFIVTVLLGSLASYLLNRVFQFGGLGFINSFLGGVFGVARAVILTIVLIYIVQLLPAGSQPQMWNESKFVKYFQPMTGWMVKNISPKLDILKEKMNQTVQKIESSE